MYNVFGPIIFYLPYTIHVLDAPGIMVKLEKRRKFNEIREKF